MRDIALFEKCFRSMTSGLVVLLSAFFVSCSQPAPQDQPAPLPVAKPELTQVRQQIQALQKQMETLYPQLVEVESAARTNHPEIQLCFDEMTARRKEYQAQLNNLPEMKALHTQLELNQAEMGMLLERQQILATPESKQ